jgi:uncharacterized protein (DUF2267 family)
MAQIVNSVKYLLIVIIRTMRDRMTNGRTDRHRASLMARLEGRLAAGKPEELRGLRPALQSFRQQRGSTALG